jgi:hypothetical protein
VEAGHYRCVARQMKGGGGWREFDDERVGQVKDVKSSLRYEEILQFLLSFYRVLCFYLIFSFI